MSDEEDYERGFICDYCDEFVPCDGGGNRQAKVFAQHMVRAHGYGWAEAVKDDGEVKKI
jgi:hypothetical protein